MAAVKPEILEGFLKKSLPKIDPDILNYVVDVALGDEFDTSDDLFEAVGCHLYEEEEEEDEIKGICKKLLNLMKGGSKDSAPEVPVQNGSMKILNAPIHIGERAKEHVEQITEQNQIWMKPAEEESLKTVDLKKLEKIDAKRKQKLDKAQNEGTGKGVEKDAGATTNQVVSKDQISKEKQGERLVDIRIENFDLAFGSKVLLKNANLVMAFGRRYGFVGRNGVGKTTLLKAIAKRDLYTAEHLTVLHVEQEVIGDDTLAVDSVLEADTVRNNLLREEQEISQKMKQTNDNKLATRLNEIFAKLEEIEADKAPAKASLILHGLGFDSEMQKTATKHFSGGWRMRISLARALFTKPDLLLLDEPTNMLDVKAILWLENYLQSWPTTIFVVSHDRMFLDAVATDIIFLHSKDLDYYKGNYTQFETTKEEKLKNQQREYEAQKQYREHLQAFIDRWRVNANRAAQAQSKIKILEKLPDLKPVDIEPIVTLKLPETDIPNATMLRFDEVTFAYPETDRNIFEKVDLTACGASRIAVVGENGSGKTTLLKILLGENEPSAGVRHTHRQLRLGYFSQHHVDSLSMDQSSFLMLKERFPGKLDQEYRTHLGRYGVSGELAMRPISSLSGGQKSRVAFSVMCWHEPNFFILDEPTNHLDIETVEALGHAINAFRGGLILVSHNEQLIQMVAKETWLVGQKTVTRIEGGFMAYKKALEEEFQRIGAF